MDVTSDPEKNSHMICSHPFPQQMDPPLTTPGDDIVMKDITPALSDECVLSIFFKIFKLFNHC